MTAPAHHPPIRRLGALTTENNATAYGSNEPLAITYEENDP